MQPSAVNVWAVPTIELIHCVGLGNTPIHGCIDCRTSLPHGNGIGCTIDRLLSQCHVVDTVQVAIYR